MADFLVTQVSLVGTGAAQTGIPVKVSNCDKLSMSFIITHSANITAATLTLTGTNDDARAIDSSTVWPTLTTGSLISAVPANVALTSNVLTWGASAVTAGTYEIVLNYSSFPKYVKPVWGAVTGGGTMVTQVTISAWSTST